MVLKCEVYAKNKIKSSGIGYSISFLMNGLPSFAQQTDPALTGAVIAQTVELKNLHKQRKKRQEQIIAAETAVTLALDRVHSVENKMLEYLSMRRVRCRTSIRLNVQGIGYD